jgi:hypothetical protein
MQDRIKRERWLAILLSIFAFAAVGLLEVQAQEKKPNILVIFGDDIGQSNISAYTHGLVGYKTPNIDRLAREGTMFTDYYAVSVRALRAGGRSDGAA